MESTSYLTHTRSPKSGDSTFCDLSELILTNVDAPEMILSLTGRLRAAESDNLTVFERALAGDLDAFETLMRSHERQVLGTALRLLGRLEDAQDAAQGVFIP